MTVAASRTASTADSYFNSKRWRFWKNVSTTTCPAFGCVALSPWTKEQAESGPHPTYFVDGKTPVFYGREPTEYSKRLGSAVCLAANGPHPVRPGQVGIMTQDWPVRMLSTSMVGNLTVPLRLATPLVGSWNLSGSAVGDMYGSVFRVLEQFGVGTSPSIRVSVVAPHNCEHFASFSASKGPFELNGKTLLVNDHETCELVSDPRIVTWPEGETLTVTGVGAIIGGVSVDMWPVEGNESGGVVNVWLVDQSSSPENAMGRGDGSVPHHFFADFIGRVHIAFGFFGSRYWNTGSGQITQLRLASSPLHSMMCRVNIWGMLARPVGFGDVGGHMELFP